jgi:hypothetical protein
MMVASRMPLPDAPPWFHQSSGARLDTGYMADDPSASKKAADEAAQSTLSQLAAKILDQLSLSAWLPAAVFAATFTLEFQFRDDKVHGLGEALSNITKHVGPFLLLIIPVIVLTTMVTQAFSFGAIRVLEGYWQRRGPVGWWRTFLLKHQDRRFDKLTKRREEAGFKAFSWARSKLIGMKYPVEVINWLELKAVSGRDVDPPAGFEQFRVLTWYAQCRPWEVAKVDQLDRQLGEYTELRARKMPTRLGNVHRRYEDELQNVDKWVGTFAMENRSRVSPGVQLQHDQFRQRLDMYCTLVFVTLACIPVTVALLVTEVPIWAWLIVCGGFAVLAWISYLSAIASAHAYGATLRVMDEAATKAKAAAKPDDAEA